MKKLWLIGFLVLVALPAKAQLTQVSALVQDSNGERYVNCSWSVVFQNQNTVPGSPPSQPAALLVGQQGTCDSSGNLRVSLADNVNTITPRPSQWRFSICSAPGYVPGGTYCQANMLVTITGATQNLTSFFQPLMPLLPTGGGGGGGGAGYITDATPLMGLMKTGSTLGLQSTCVQGQYLGWTGTSWACTGAGVGGGTSVTINGTSAVPNILNFNNTTPIPPAGTTPVQFLLNGNSVSAYVTGGGGGGSLTVNGGTGGSDLNDRLPAFPPNGINISWQAANGHISGAIVGDGIATHCFLGTGVFAQCPGGGGGGGTLPTTAIYDLFASTGAGAAQATGVLGSNGFLRARVYTATGDVGGGSPAFQLFPNASVEYFPTGYTTTQGSFGATNGLALYMSHSGASSATGNGGIALGGGNSSGVGNQVYLDCEIAGCDFKVPVTYLGSGIGGGGGVSLPPTPAWDIFASTGAGAAQSAGTGVRAETGFLEGKVLQATGAGSTASPFTPPNASMEYFPTGGYGVGGANGLAIHFSHSGTAINGGIALGGGNAQANPFQIYLDCESAPTLGCNFPEPVTINDGTNNGLAMTSAGGSLPTLTSTQGGIGIGPGGVPQMNVSGAGWVNIPTAASGGTVNWGSIGGTLAAQSDLNSALNAKVGTGSTLTPTICTAGQAAAGILGNGNATGCFTPPGGSGGITGPTTNGGLIQTSTTLGLLTTCTANQHLAYISNAWTCTSNSPTATALAAAPTTCTAGQAATGILSSGNATGCFTPGGSGSVSNPITFPTPASALAQTTAGNGGIGVDLNGITKMPNLNGNWVPLANILVNGNQLPTNAVNFGANTGTVTWTTPTGITPPPNGYVMSWGRLNGSGNQQSNVQVAIIGNGNAGDCLLGTGVFATCPGGGGGGSGTVGTGTSGEFAIYNGTNSIVGSPDLTFDGSYIVANQTFSATNLVTQSVNVLSTTPTLTPVGSQNLFETNSSGLPYFSPNGAAFQPFVLGPSTACSANQVLRWVSPNWTCYTPTAGTVTGATANGGLTGTTTLGLVTSGCTNGMVMQYSGTAWNCQTPTTGGSGVVNSGTAGQFAYYASTGAAVSGNSTLTDGGTAITSTVPLVFSGAGPHYVQFPSFANVAPTPVSGTAQLALYGAGGTSGAGLYFSNGATTAGNAFKMLAEVPLVNSTQMSTQSFTLSGTSPNTCQTTNAPGNSRCVVFWTAGPNTGQISGGIVGDGNPANCLNGVGNYVPCSGGTAGTLTCTLSADASFAGGNICTQALGATAKQWTVHCAIPWNFTGGSGTATVNIGFNLTAAPTVSPSYVMPVMWSTTAASNMGAVQLNAAAGNTNIVQANLTAGAGGTIFQLIIDGTIPAAANTTFSVFGSLSGGTSPTAAFRPGFNCVLQ